MSIKNMHERLVSGENIEFSYNGRNFETFATSGPDGLVTYDILENSKTIDTFALEPGNSGPIDAWAEVIDERKR